MKYMIVAYGKNRVIGVDGAMPWEGKLPADMRHFRQMTSGQVVVMGRRTFESIGRPLPNRQNIIISRRDFTVDGATIAHSLEEAYMAAAPDRDMYIIGGGQIYELALESVDAVVTTEIDAEFTGDTYFPALPAGWQESKREDHLADENNSYDYSFVTYTRRR